MSRAAQEARERARRSVRRKQKPAKSAAQVVNNIIRPRVSGYRADYPNNPLYAVLTELVQERNLDLAKDERMYLADLICEKLSAKVAESGLGAAVGLRIENFIKGRFRADVHGA